MNKYPDIIWITEDPLADADGGPVYWAEEQIEEDDRQYIAVDAFFEVLKQLEEKAAIEEEHDARRTE